MPQQPRRRCWPELSARSVGQTRASLELASRTSRLARRARLPAAPLSARTAVAHGSGGCPKQPALAAAVGNPNSVTATERTAAPSLGRVRAATSTTRAPGPRLRLPVRAAHRLRATRAAVATAALQNRTGAGTGNLERAAQQAPAADAPWASPHSVFFGFHSPLARPAVDAGVTRGAAEQPFRWAARCESLQLSVSFFSVRSSSGRTGS